MASLAARLHVATCHLAEADSTGPVAAAFNGTTSLGSTTVPPWNEPALVHASKLGDVLAALLAYLPQGVSHEQDVLTKQVKRSSCCRRFFTPQITVGETFEGPCRVLYLDMA